MKTINIFLFFLAGLCFSCNPQAKEELPPKHYTVNFSGEGVDIEPQTIAYGDYATEPDNPERGEGFYFCGWFTDTGTFIKKWDFKTNIVTQDTMLYTKWIEWTEDNNDKVYYYGFDEKIEITPVRNKILVKKKSSASRQFYENLILNRYGNVQTEWYGDDKFKLEFENETDKKCAIQSFLSDDNILSVRIIYNLNGGEFGFTNEIVVKYKDNIEDAEKISILKSFGLDHSETTAFSEIYSISKDRNILEVANKLYETGLFEYAYPDIISKWVLHTNNSY